MESGVPEPFRERYPRRAAEGFRREIRDRAGILMRLGRSEDQARFRCRRNVDWELELSDRPAFAGEVDSLVKNVYSRR